MKAKDVSEAQDLQTIDDVYCAGAYQKALKKDVLTPLSEKVSDVLQGSLFDPCWGVFDCIKPV